MPPEQNGKAILDSDHNTRRFVNRKHAQSYLALCGLIFLGHREHLRLLFTFSQIFQWRISITVRIL